LPFHASALNPFTLKDSLKHSIASSYFPKLSINWEDEEVEEEEEEQENNV
jgi:hypothetical protein